ncbi:MAG: spherulation-specific family 4 protein [Micromonosporaceae bacterium]
MLVPIEAHPELDPAAWDRAAALGRRGIAVIQLPIDSLRDHEPGPFARRAGGKGPATSEWWTAVAAAIQALVTAGVPTLGQVSLGYATRPMVEVIGALTRWSVLPVTGVFLDHAPAGPCQIEPVAQAARVARRAGLPTVVVNPGVPVDPLYRRLGVALCTFEGSWTEYRAWTDEGAQAGDGHLVYGVPRADADAAWRLAASRGAGLGLVAEHQLGHGATIRPTPAPMTGRR